MKKKLSVQLSFQNPFWKRMKMENTSSDDTFFRRETNYRTMRMLQVSVSYRFGTLKDAIKKVKRGINNDDVKSGGCKYRIEHGTHSDTLRYIVSVRVFRVFRVQYNN